MILFYFLFFSFDHRKFLFQLLQLLMQLLLLFCNCLFYNLLFQLLWNIVNTQCFRNYSLFWLLINCFLLFIPFVEIVHFYFWYDCLCFYCLLLYYMLLIVLICILCLVARLLIFWDFLLFVWFVRYEVYSLITLLLAWALFFLFRYSIRCWCFTTCRYFIIRRRLSIF